MEGDVRRSMKEEGRSGRTGCVNEKAEVVCRTVEKREMGI